ncbi:MAG: DegT/DnrJ/EryC1/StrS family aminotransferase [candidate division KSB1 bacterium]|nr:DegT/DnrJ/EryC1/StrS family aminotransferase [candidate division KSB1 bacterium]
MAKLAITGGTPVKKKPFPKWPVWGDAELANLKQVLESGKWGSMQGNMVKTFAEKFAAYHQATFGICVNSGTTALSIALKSLGIGCGDEVILPAYTFVATATAILDVGAIPIFVDIDLNTFNIDVRKIEEAITERTAAIMPVHFGGRPAEMDDLMAIAQRHNLKVIEDAAQAWGSAWNHHPVGAIGDAGAFSFQSSKNITSAEGGIILTNDAETAQFCRSFANCGRVDGGVWYEHYYLGGNFRMTEFQAAVLLAQFERYPQMQELREKNARYLNRHLAQIEGIEVLADDPRITRNSIHLYIWRYKKEHFNNIPKTKFIEALQKEGLIVSAGYSIPLYRQPLFKNQAFGSRGKKIDLGVNYNDYFLPNTERACYEEAIWFPQFVLLGDDQDMNDIVTAVTKVKGNIHEISA